MKKLYWYKINSKRWKKKHEKEREEYEKRLLRKWKGEYNKFCRECGSMKKNVRHRKSIKNMKRAGFIKSPARVNYDSFTIGKSPAIKNGKAKIL